MTNKRIIQLICTMKTTPTEKISSFHRPLHLLSLIPLFALSATAAWGQTVWNDPTTDPHWNNPANWSNGLPNSTTQAIISGSGGIIELTENVSNGFSRLEFSGSNSTYTLKSADGALKNLHAPSGTGGFLAGFEAQNMSLTIEGVWVNANAGSSFAYNGSGNTLNLTGAGTRLSTVYSAGFTIGSGNGSIAANSNNSITVSDGAVLQVGLFNVGSKGAGNHVTITGTGSQLRIVGTGTNFHLTVGNANSDSTNRLAIVDGAIAEVARHQTRIVGGSLVVGRNSELRHIHATESQSLVIGSKGALFGAGKIVADTLEFTSISGTGGTGARVYVGETESDFGRLDFEGEWKNADIQLLLQIGDISAGAVDAVNYDLLNIAGQFVFGGNLSIDLGMANFGEIEEVQLISWNSSSGNQSDLTVTFLNGSGAEYEIRDNGLYVQAIPEPSTVVLLTLLSVAGFMIIKRRK